MTGTLADRSRYFGFARELERLARHVDALATVTWRDADVAAAHAAAVRRLRALADELDAAAVRGTAAT